MNSFDLFQCGLRGVHLIDASAGTGKTYTITGLVLRLLLEKGLTIEKILVVTYTEAATEELRDKIRTMLRRALAAFAAGESDDPMLRQLIDNVQDRHAAFTKLSDALAAFDLAAIYTIHGFCQRMLKEYGLETAGLFDSELITDDLEWQEEIAMDFWRSHFYAASFLFVTYAHEKFHRDLSSLLKLSLCQPGLEIIPKDSGVDHQKIIVGLEKRYTVLFYKLVEIWERERQTLVRILLESKALDRRAYRISTVHKWLAAMDGWLGRSKPLIFLFDGFVRLTSQGMGEKLKKGQAAPDHPFFRQCGIFAELHEELIGQYDQLLLSLKIRFGQYLRDELPARKNKSNVLCFDDLLTGLHKGLSGDGGERLAKAVRLKFPAAFIDEFQDTDPVQYEIFAKIYADAQEELLFLIGDPKQAIYSFRGADIFTYMAAADQVEKRHTLGLNYRSTAELITAVNTIFSTVSQPFLFQAIPFRSVEPAGIIADCLQIDGQQAKGMQICWIDNIAAAGKSVGLINKEKAQQAILDQVSSEIARLLGLGRDGRAMIGIKSVCPGDIAILVRTNREARLTHKALAARNVASVIQGSESIFVSWEAVELLQLLTALADPGNPGKVRAALATDIMGGDGATLARLMADENEWIKRLLQFRHYHYVWVQHGFMSMFKEFERVENVRAGLASFGNGERRLTNISHLVEILHQAEIKKKLGMAGLLKFFARMLAEPDDREDEYQLRLESDTAKVRIVTIHKAKGLQYSIVFCPFCWNGSRLSAHRPLTYHQGEEGDLVVDLDPDPTGTGFEFALREELAEDLRLLYVALTRAQYGCYLFWGAFRGAESSALAYLFHLPAELRQGDYPFRVISEAVAGRYKNADDHELLEDLQSIIHRGAGAITCGTLASQKQTEFLPKHQSEPLELRDFSGNIDSNWKITSFSALTRDRIHAAELPDRDPNSEVLKVAVVEKNNFSAGDIFSFPTGARAGTFFHEILEHVDFQRKDRGVFKDLVQDKLAEFGFDFSWHGVVCSTIERVLTTPLLADGGLVLADIRAEQRIHEMEFYLPLASNGIMGVDGLLERHGLPPVLNLSDEWRLSLVPRQGFLKGFIDLIFCWQGKYYLLDWKSNYLGNSFQHYERPEMLKVMTEAAYQLQYHLYTIALHHYLATRLPKYRYEEHFGGVFYLFLRGMNPKNISSAGVFFDLPDFVFIEEFSALIVD